MRIRHLCAEGEFLERDVDPVLIQKCCTRKEYRVHNRRAPQRSWLDGQSKYGEAG